MPQSTPFTAFINGQLTPNEFAVLITVQANANGNRLNTSSTEISNRLNGTLSRHAVARALRNLQDNGWLSWQTRTGSNRTSTITVN
jgi:MarR-like DNA-binding transcriptional regulator SgrR of sgrS sRNA